MKTALITGATDGIGRETARQLLAGGWRVLVHGRSEAKAGEHAGMLGRETGNTQAAGVWADLSDMARRWRNWRPRSAHGRRRSMFWSTTLASTSAGGA